MHKATIALFALLAVASALQGNHNQNGRHEIGQKQKYILQLLRNVSQKNMYTELSALGQSWNPEHIVDRYALPSAVTKFMSMYKQGMLPQGEIFHVYNDSHLKEAVALFDMLYFAKDFDTFLQTAAWARDHVNEGQFVYALCVAAVHREDCQGVVLAPLYEVYPQLYLRAGDMADFYSAKMQNVNKYVKMTNWTQAYTNPEQLLGYFTEDAGLNAYYAYAHVYMPFWMNCEQYGMANCQARGQAFYYFHQQLLAHYNLHRMANYLPEQSDFDWQQPIKYGFNPDLAYHNGAYFPSRPQDKTLSSIKAYSVEDIKAIESRIKDAIDSGFVYGKDGNKISITSHIKGINILGNLIEGNQDSVNSRYYGAYASMLRNLFALIMDPDMEHGVAPGVMGHYETALRDPAFYYYTSYIMGFFKQYKDNLPYYRTEDLAFHGVAVKDVAVDKLVTYFDLFDMDVTNAVEFASMDEMDKFDYVAKAMRLNHQPFTYKIKVSSDKKTNAVVRVFLGPSTEYLYTNLYGNQASDAYYGHDTADMERLREYFVELDRFPVQLKNGDNLIERHSRQFTSTVGDAASFKSMLKSGQFNTESVCGFPDRLALPMGHKAGVPYTLFVMVSEATSAEGVNAVPAYTVCNGMWNAIDDQALGFPFDRKIDNFGRFYTPNMYFKNVFIFHKDSSDLHANNQAVFKKSVNGFDHAYQTAYKYTPSHKIVDQDIYQEDDEVHSFM